MMRTATIVPVASKNGQAGNHPLADARYLSRPASVNGCCWWKADV